MTRPNIQIDDEVREMTEEEHSEWLAISWTLQPAEEWNPNGNQ